jgi:hypothetical protein
MASKINPYDVLDQLAARKPSDWSDIPTLSESTITPAQRKFLKGLPVLSVADEYSPLLDYARTDEVKEAIGKGTRFLAVKSDGSVYYVYTSGYNYFRYALRVEMGASAPAWASDLPRLFSYVVLTDEVEPQEENQEIPKPSVKAGLDIEQVKQVVLAAEVLVKYIRLRGGEGVTKELASELERAIREIDL